MSLSGGMILAGAASRLLPVSVPFRFFVAAVYFHCFVWLVFGFAAAGATDFIGGLGAPLAALHVATLGVFSITAMGATLQLLPVATRAPITALWRAKLVFILAFVGVHLLVAGMATGIMALLLSGAVLAAAALLIFAIITAINLWAAPQANVAMAYAWSALSALILLLAAGLLVAFDFQFAFLADHSSVAAIHFVLGIFGFFGLLAFGFSTVLLPMFTLSPSVAPKMARAVLAIAVIAILAAIAGLLVHDDRLIVMALLAGMIAAILHIVEIERVLRRRMRRKLDLAFVLIRVAHGALVAGLLIGLLLMLGVPVPGKWTMFGWVVIGGWLLTFLFGILQRIMPFLASMHAGKSRGRSPLLSEIGRERPLRIHAVCHFAALILIGLGIVTGIAPLLQLGAAAGFLGSLAFGWFAATVVSYLVPRNEEPALKAG